MSVSSQRLMQLAATKVMTWETGCSWRLWQVEARKTAERGGVDKAIENWRRYLELERGQTAENLLLVMEVWCSLSRRNVEVERQKWVLEQKLMKLEDELEKLKAVLHMEEDSEGYVKLRSAQNFGLNYRRGDQWTF